MGQLLSASGLYCRQASLLLLTTFIKRLDRPMSYRDIPPIIPILAAGYLLVVYLLLALARRSVAESHFASRGQGSRE